MRHVDWRQFQQTPWLATDMGFSYDDFQNDLGILRQLSVSPCITERYESVINLLFCVINLFDEKGRQVERQSITIARLKELLFGKASGETVDSEAVEINKEDNTDAPSEEKTSSDANAEPAAAQKKSTDKPQSQKGNRNGRLGYKDYPGAEVITCEHDHLKPGDTCPLCRQAKLSLLKESQKKIVFTGAAPLVAQLYLLQQLRCGLCQAYFTAPAPVDVTKKYTPSAKATLAIMHCLLGTTYYGLAKLQHNAGMPLPASTQCDQMESLAGPLYPIVRELTQMGANRGVCGQDDTNIKIRELIKDNKLNTPDRKGMFTSVFVADGEHPIIIYNAGRKHAGEHFDRIIKMRDQALEEIKRITDALSANGKHKGKSKPGHCNVHAFRRFKPLLCFYPEPCAYILHLYGQVFESERHCTQTGLTGKARLAYHVKHSKPLMDELFDYANEQLELHEPNCALVTELNYLLKHREKLTLFLREPDVWLDTNWCERMLKIPIKYRKNSLFFGTVYSASYLCVIMSVIATAKENGVNVHHYLTALQEYEALVWQSPERWLPWNYTAALNQAIARQSSAMAA